MSVPSKLAAVSIGATLLLTLSGCSSAELEADRLEAYTSVSKVARDGSGLAAYKVSVIENNAQYETAVFALQDLKESSKELSDEAFIEASKEKLADELAARELYAGSIANYYKADLAQLQSVNGTEFSVDCALLIDTLADDIMSSETPPDAVRAVTDCIISSMSSAVADQISSSNDSADEVNDRFGGDTVTPTDPSDDRFE